MLVDNNSLKNAIRKHYDIVVIGSGGGAKISSPSSHLGYKVALCERGRLGGTCLNRGCIPSKMLIHPADVANTIDESEQFNISSNGYKVHFEDLVNRVAKVIDEESFSINPKIEANKNIDWYRHTVRFTGPKELYCADLNTFITGDRVFIATGSRPTEPIGDHEIKGLKDTPYMTSTEALRLTRQPKELIVVGGGYIACELGHYFASLGTKVTMVVRSDVMLRHADGEVREEFKRVFSKHKNIDIKFCTTINNVSYENETFHVELLNSNTKQVEKREFDQFLLSIGVTPNTEDLDLEKAGIETKQGGYIKVDDYLKTSVECVWAMGDVVGNYLFRHSVNFESDYLMETVVRRHEFLQQGGKDYPIDYVGMPSAVFTKPQVASVGETEEELQKRGAQYVKGVNPYSSSAMGMALRSDSGFVKLLVEKETRKILGCHIIGEEASVLIHQITPIMRNRGTLDDLLYSIFIHPALNEIVRNAGRKARDALVASGEHIPLLLKLK